MTSTTSITSISSTIQSALEASGYGSYARYAEPVVVALQDREMEIVDKLVDYAVDAGQEPEEIRAYLAGVGMTVRSTAWPPNVTDEPGANQPSGIEALLSDLAARVASLTEFARNNGYRG